MCKTCQSCALKPSSSCSAEATCAGRSPPWSLPRQPHRAVADTSAATIADTLAPRAVSEAPPPPVPPPPMPVALPDDPSLILRVRQALTQRGALFFHELHAETRAFPADLLAAIWELLHQGVVTNDTLLPLRSLARPEGREPARGRGRPGGRHDSRPDRRPDHRSARGRHAPPGGEGRWSLLFPSHIENDTSVTDTERAEARVTGLLLRHGVLLRESLNTEDQPGGFGALYPVLDAMEATGRVRRGYFVEGLGATQFALRGAEERLSPILMTALCAGLALVPLILRGNVPGHEIEHPMAWVILGGLATSTALNLFFLPTLYARFGRRAIAAADLPPAA